MLPLFLLLYVCIHYEVTIQAVDKLINQVTPRVTRYILKKELNVRLLQQAYMKVPSIERLSYFVVPPLRGGMEVFKKHRITTRQHPPDLLKNLYLHSP